jgi:CsoR family transcriptional regulator, copper-sensing transcriptional repressor
MEASRAPGYEDGKAQLNARLRRVEGQVRGLQRMVQNGEYCIDVLTQISAAQAALRKVALVLLEDHLRRCVLGTTEAEDERVREVMEATARLLGSG